MSAVTGQVSGMAETLASDLGTVSIKPNNLNLPADGIGGWLLGGETVPNTQGKTYTPTQNIAPTITSALSKAVKVGKDRSDALSPKQ